MPSPTVKQPVVEIRQRQNLVEMVAVSIGDERLTKLIAPDESHDALHAMRVQAVKDVIKQQYRTRVAPRMAEQVILSEF